MMQNLRLNVKKVKVKSTLVYGKYGKVKTHFIAYAYDEEPDAFNHCLSIFTQVFHFYIRNLSF